MKIKLFLFICLLWGHSVYALASDKEPIGLYIERIFNNTVSSLFTGLPIKEKSHKTQGGEYFYTGEKGDEDPKRKFGFRGGDLLIPLFLFNQMDYEQRELFKGIIFLPTSVGGKKTNNPAPEKELPDGKPKAALALPLASIAGVITKKNDKDPNSEEETHQHRGTSENCSALGCNRGPCICPSCKNGAAPVGSQSSGTSVTGAQAVDTGVPSGAVCGDRSEMSEEICFIHLSEKYFLIWTKKDKKLHSWHCDNGWIVNEIKEIKDWGPFNVAHSATSALIAEQVDESVWEWSIHHFTPQHFTEDVGHQSVRPLSSVMLSEHRFVVLSGDNSLTLWTELPGQGWLFDKLESRIQNLSLFANPHGGFFTYGTNDEGEKIVMSWTFRGDQLHSERLLTMTGNKRFLGLHSCSDGNYYALALDGNMNDPKARLISWNSTTQGIHELGSFSMFKNRTVLPSGRILSWSVNEQQEQEVHIWTFLSGGLWIRELIMTNTLEEEIQSSLIEELSNVHLVVTVASYLGNSIELLTKHADWSSRRLMYSGDEITFIKKITANMLLVFFKSGSTQVYAF